MNKTTTMGIKLDESTRERLTALGRQRDRTPHYLMRTAIREYLDREEAREQERHEILERWEAYRQTGEAIDEETMDRWLSGLAKGAVEPWPRGG